MEGVHGNGNGPTHSPLPPSSTSATDYNPVFMIKRWLARVESEAEASGRSEAPARASTHVPRNTPSNSPPPALHITGETGERRGLPEIPAKESGTEESEAQRDFWGTPARVGSRAAYAHCLAKRTASSGKARVAFSRATPANCTSLVAWVDRKALHNVGRHAPCPRSQQEEGRQ